MSKKTKRVDNGRVSEVRPTHKETGTDTRGMFLGKTDTMTISYRLDVLGRDLWNDREAAIEMYAQMAASRIRSILGPVTVTK